MAFDLLIDVGNKDNAKAFLDDSFKKKRKIIWFGHREYKKGDPRNPLIKRISKSLAAEKSNP